MRPRGAVFDCDGLLVDSERCWRAAYGAAVAQAGADLGAEELDSLCASLNGASVEIAAQRLGAALGAPVSAGFLRRGLDEAVAALSPAAMPGAARLLASLEGELPLAVASNGPPGFVDAILRGAGLRRFFAHVVSAEEAGEPKPGPAVYLEACRRLSVDPAEAVALEDSAMGAAAARAAGIFLVAVPSRPDEEIEADLSVKRLDDPRVYETLGLRAS